MTEKKVVSDFDLLFVRGAETKMFFFKEESVIRASLRNLLYNLLINNTAIIFYFRPLTLDHNRQSLLALSPALTHGIGCYSRISRLVRPPGRVEVYRVSMPCEFSPLTYPPFLIELRVRTTIYTSFLPPFLSFSPDKILLVSLTFKNY